MTSRIQDRPPLIAIVTPVYNGEAFLDATMKSVQEQTYPNIMHVVLDNASTDRTPEIIESYRDKIVPLITGRNDTLLGMDENWNAALRLIPQEAAYFRILCADDVLMPEATARMAELAEHDPEISIVSTAAFRNSEQADFSWPADRNIFEGEEALRRYFTVAGILEARQMLWRREALASATPFFDLNVGQSADIDAGLRMLAPGKLGFLHEPLIMIREHEANTSSMVMRPQRIHFNDWLITLRRHGPRGFEPEAYARIEARYRRYYFRQMLKWRMGRDGRSVFERHLSLLEKMHAKPSMLDFADSLLDLLLIRLGLRRGWYSYPA